MFTIKLYRGSKMRIYEAGSFTVNSDGPAASGGRHEITLHDVPGQPDFRVDLTFENEPTTDAPVRYFDSAIIENASGKTTQMFSAAPSPTFSRAA